MRLIFSILSGLGSALYTAAFIFLGFALLRNPVVQWIVGLSALLVAVAALVGYSQAKRSRGL